MNTTEQKYHKSDMGRAFTEQELEAMLPEHWHLSIKTGYDGVTYYQVKDDRDSEKLSSQQFQNLLMRLQGIELFAADIEWKSGRRGASWIRQS